MIKMESDKKVKQTTPTQKDSDPTKTMIVNYLLKDYEIPEYDVNSEETEKRKKVIKEIQGYVSEWQTKVKEVLNITDPGDAQLLTYGSFSMDVSAKDGDLDTLLVVPDYIDRDKHFFGTFLDKLRECADIKEIQPIKDAYVPLIKLKISSIMVDIVFAKVNRKVLESNETINFTEPVLRDMSAEMIRGVNAFRTGKKILESVPNIFNYKMTLRAIKLWARRKAIYSNPQGFLSGISCAIMTAKICKQNPEMLPHQLVYAFFKTYSEWRWADKPVMVDDSQLNFKPSLPLSEKTWTENEKTCMMIITPVYPFSNTTYNVSYISYRVIVNHLIDARKILDESKEFEKEKLYDWDSLFKPYEFFRSYVHFLEVKIFSNDTEQFLKWKGLVESRLKVLTRNLEVIVRTNDYENNSNEEVIIHPYPFGIPLKEGKDTVQHCLAFYYGIKWKNMYLKPYSKKMDLSQPVEEFVQQEIFHKRLETPDCEISFSHLTREDLNDCVFGTEERPSWATKRSKFT